MNLAKYSQSDLSDMKVYNKLQADLIDDLRAQLAMQGLELVSTQPNMFCFGAVAATPAAEDGTKRFIHITIKNVAQNPDWAQDVSLRRMSSERDWKGDCFHHCSWDEVGASCAVYLTAEYDNEIM